VGKQENCRVAVSLSLATWSSSLPIAYRLYLPPEWTEDAKRRKKAEVPKEIEFQTRPQIALDQIRAAAAANLDRGVVWPMPPMGSTRSSAMASPPWNYSMSQGCKFRSRYGCRR
jgi:hypothetical protein